MKYQWGCRCFDASCYLLKAREKFSTLLEETEDWLYEDGENQSKKVYQDKLAALKVSARRKSLSSYDFVRRDNSYNTSREGLPSFETSLSGHEVP